jgi:hypothetical protein
VTDFVDGCLESFWSAPRVARLTASPTWTEDLLRCGEHEDVAPLREVLVAFAHERSLEPLLRFLDDGAAVVSASEYARASAFGVAQLATSPGPAYAVTLASVTGWAIALGDDLTGQTDGFPDRGWLDLPHAYARVALKLGDVRGARRVVDTAYDVLMAARYPDHPALVAGIAAYRTLAGAVSRRMEQAVDNLADDLLASSLRTHLLALMWTLGFVPECLALRRCGETPSKSMLRTLIRLSLERIPHDPLTQYVWLELKDRPSLDLRSHHFFYAINRRYHQYLPDDTWQIMPSQAYAQTLVGWLDGSLGLDDVAIYLDVIGQVREFEPYREHSPGSSDWSVYLRMISLAYLLAEEHDMFAGDPSAAEQLVTWRSLLDQVIAMRGRHHLNPHRADLEGTLNYPLFHVVERAPGAEAVHELERYRAAALTFQLAVTPPVPGAPPAEEAELNRVAQGGVLPGQLPVPARTLPPLRHRGVPRGPARAGPGERAPRLPGGRAAPRRPGAGERPGHRGVHRGRAGPALTLRGLGQG